MRAFTLFPSATVVKQTAFEVMAVGPVSSVFCFCASHGSVELSPEEKAAVLSILPQVSVVVIVSHQTCHFVLGLSCLKKC